MTPVQLKNLITLGNATHLISQLALNIVGQDIATEINGVAVTKSSVNTLVAAELNKVLSEKKHA